jgi:hypothetical protein
LSLDCFLAPSDLKKDEEKGMVPMNIAKLPYKICSSFKISASKVAAISVDDSCVSESIQDM